VDPHKSPDDIPAGARFVHLDVLTAYSPWCSPSTPEQYVQALARQYPVGPSSDGLPRRALAIADYGLHSAVKTAVACERAGIDHIVGLRLRVVPERAKRTFFFEFTRMDVGRTGASVSHPNDYTSSF
jgi:DNA polymerase III alpha subunit